MARYRTIKPELCADEKLTACSVDARFLFLCLLCFVDDMGRKQYSTRRIKAEVFPADDEFTVHVVEGLVQELANVGVLELYDVGQNHYLRIPHFLDHQVINKPGHSKVPPSPSEGPDAEECRCQGCKIRAAQRGTKRKTVIHPEWSGSSTGVLPEEDGNSTVVGTAGGGSGIGSGKGDGDGVRTTPTPALINAESGNHRGAGSGTSQAGRGEDRKALYAAADILARGILDLLEIPARSLIQHELTETLLAKAKAENTSAEVAANKIAGRAAVVKRENPPDQWGTWFFDARYTYVPQGDNRLRLRGYVVRPVCGGPLCSEGWEPVTVNGERILRRCPACVQAWKDAGVLD